MTGGEGGRAVARVATGCAGCAGCAGGDCDGCARTVLAWLFLLLGIPVGIEIERKFLVTSDAWRAAAHKVVPMAQGYLNDLAMVDSGAMQTSVRVRIEGETADDMTGFVGDETGHRARHEQERRTCARLGGRRVSRRRLRPRRSR